MRIRDWSSDVCSSDLDPAPSVCEVDLATGMDLEDIVSPGLDADILRPAPTHLEGLAGAIGRRIAQFLARRIHSIIDCELERLALDASFGDQSGLNARSAEHTSELQSLMPLTYAV